MGDDRYFQIQRPRTNLFADAYEYNNDRGVYLRQWRQTPNGKAHSARRHTRTR